MIQIQQDAAITTTDDTMGIHVDTTSFNTCMFAWSREKDSIQTDNNRGSSTNTLHYGRAADAISHASAERALELLTIMEEMQEAGNVNVKPDVYSYTTTIQAFARCRQPQQAQKGTATNDQPGLQPSRLTYTALMSAFAKAGEPEKAADLLQDMMDAYQEGDFVELKPDTVAFSCVMDGWARVASIDRPEAAEEVLTLLDTMKARASEGMGPNSQTYTSVLTALAKCGTDEMCEMARSLLQEMEDAANPRLRPSRIQYNAVLNAYAKSPRAEKALKANKLFAEMQRHPRFDCRPDTISYNTLLETCANSFGNRSLKDMSFLVALNAFKAVLATADNSKNKKRGNKNDLDSLVTPTSTTFAQFTKICRKLLPTKEKKLSAVQRSLAMCRKMGMLNHMVVRQGQLACRSEEDWKRTAAELAEYVDWKRDFRKCSKQVPKEWTCHARR